MEKVLTVIIPTYNMEKYLDGCLTSLIIEDEKMDSMEVLVINDGSKDSSSEIAHGYESRYPGTFRVIDKENGNYGSCVNRGLTEAKGKYIKILDADDFFISEGLSSLIESLAVSDDDVIITDVVCVDGEGHEHGRSHKPLREDRLYVPGEIDGIALKGLFMHGLTYCSEILRKMGYRQTEGISYTDLEWAYYPMMKANSVRYLPVFVYSYRLGREGQTVDASLRCKNMWMEEKIIIRMVDSLENNMSVALPGSHIYLENRLAYYIERLYFYYLLEYKDLLDEKKLVEFDKYLKAKSVNIYSISDEFDCHTYIGSFKYIHDWRRRRSRKTARFLIYDLYRYLSNIKHLLTGK